MFATIPWIGAIACGMYIAVGQFDLGGIIPVVSIHFINKPSLLWICFLEKKGSMFIDSDASFEYDGGIRNPGADIIAAQVHHHNLPFGA